MTRKGSVSIHMLIFLILGLLLIWFVGFPLLQNVYEGWQSGFVCDGSCASSCGDGYRHELKGDTYCKKHFSGTQAGGGQCCVPLSREGHVAFGSDVRLAYSTVSKDPLPDGATVTLVPRYSQNAYVASGTFTLSFTDAVKNNKCYWRVGDRDWQEDATDKVITGSDQFQNLFEQYNDFRKQDDFKNKDIQGKNLETCSQLGSKGSMNIPFLSDSGGVVNSDLFGQRMRFSLIILDKDCTGDASLCDSYEHSINILVPDRNPEIRLTVDDNLANTKDRTLLPTGETNSFKLTITEPYAKCISTYNASIDLGEASLILPFKQVATTAGIIDQEERCFGEDYVHKFTLLVPESHAKAIPFDITVATTLGEERELLTQFPFQIAPEERVRVNGPSPGYAREKFIDLSCHDVSCNGFEVLPMTTPMDCSAEKSGNSGEFIDIIDQLAPYGGENSAMWRYRIASEDLNDQYLCFRAKTDNGFIYSLGLHQGLPSKVAIDATPPEFSVMYDPLKGVVKMDCTDVGEFKSGCAQFPYSYAYVTDPLRFATSVLTLGTLSADWSGCPDPDTGHWVRWTGTGDLPFASYDIRVGCFKAEDNAGNSKVKSRLLYSSAEALGAFLVAYKELS